MKAAAQRELDDLDRHTSFPPPWGRSARYIGLFGTVGHHARLHRPGNAGNATLATVAPGIAEALIATAIGLFAAIPAVVAYNRFAYDIDRFATRFDTFMGGVFQHPPASGGQVSAPFSVEENRAVSGPVFSCLSFSQGQVRGAAGVQGGGVEERQRRVAGRHQQRDFGSSTTRQPAAASRSMMSR